MRETWFTGEIIRAEEGSEDTYSTDKISEVLRMVRSLGDGDALTINVSEREVFGGNSR